MFHLDSRISKDLELVFTVNFVENMELQVGTTQINRNRTVMFVVRIEHAVFEMDGS